MTLDFDEGDELRALRAAVADLGSRYGQSYFLEQARAGGHTDALWAEAGKAGFLGVNLPEEYGGGGGGMVELSIVLRGARRRRLPAADDGRLAGDLRHRHRPVRHDASRRTRWLPGPRRRVDDHGVRDHRARRRLELARDHHRGPPGRRRVGAQRPQGVDQRRRPGRRGARRRQAGRQRPRARCGRRCSSSRPTRRG